jgi:DNA replication protein DnaC
VPFAERNGHNHAEKSLQHPEKNLINSVPEYYEHCNFDTFETFNDATCSGKNIAMECSAKKLGLILGGQTGCGKTHLAVAIIRQNLLDNRKTFFTSHIHLLDSVRQVCTDGELTQLENDILSYDGIFIDNFGVTHIKWVIERFNNLLENILLSKKQVVITSRAESPQTLLNNLSSHDEGALLSRMKESGCKLFIIDSGDYRLRKKN